MIRFASVAAFIAGVRPVDPVYCFHPRAAEAGARAFAAAFPGEVAYAVKCNDEPCLLAALAHGGVHAWDVASLEEVQIAAVAAPALPALFMHPVKQPEHIEAAFRDHEVREFAVDDPAEVERVLAVCGHAAPLTLTVRLALPRGSALHDLSGKFGADLEEATALMRRVDRLGLACGLTFHVGSQCLDPQAFARGVRLAAAVARAAGVRPAVLDVGGGFPAPYQGDEPAIAAYAAAVAAAAAAEGLAGVPLRCEPGRALAAVGVSVIARVEAVRPGRRLLFLNDGVYGGLSELKYLPQTRFPIRALRPDGSPVPGAAEPWGLAGPTCDSVDMMPGPYALPADLRPGDYLEFGLMGAYSNALATRFNGFGARDWVEITGAA